MSMPIAALVGACLTPGCDAVLSQPLSNICRVETVSVVHSAATNACCIFVGCADGYVQRWDLDSEQNVEVYK